MKILNKKAKYEYEILDTLVTGIVLTGTEIKSVRKGNVSLSDTYCGIVNDEMFLYNSFINKFTHGSYNNHEEYRVRKLLLHKNEIKKLQQKVKEKGLTIVPLNMFINSKGLCKLEIALCKGKHLYDKRETIKQRDLDRYISTSI